MAPTLTLLMHQGRGLQCLAGLFMDKLCGSKLPEFIVDQGQQLLGSGGIARLDLREDLRYVGHKCRL